MFARRTISVASSIEMDLPMSICGVIPPLHAPGRCHFREAPSARLVEACQFNGQLSRCCALSMIRAKSDIISVHPSLPIRAAKTRAQKTTARGSSWVNALTKRQPNCRTAFLNGIAFNRASSHSKGSCSLSGSGLNSLSNTSARALWEVLVTAILHPFNPMP